VRWATRHNSATRRFDQPVCDPTDRAARDAVRRALLPLAREQRRTDYGIDVPIQYHPGQPGVTTHHALPVRTNRT
jgi:hypothetical protein